MQRSGGSGQPVKGRHTKGPKARNAPTAPTSTCYSVEEFDRVKHELAEAREREAATGEVLKVISRSAFDLQAVFDTLVELVARLCRADRASIRLARDGFFHHVASYGYTPEQDQYMNEHPVPAAKPDRGSIVGRVLSAGKAVQIEDTKADPEFKITNVPGFENVHTTFGVPLLREGKPIGVLVLMRGFVEMFTNKQIELAETFAAQAVIAIENTRLLSELRQRTDDLSESLQQQTATSNVLEVISRSAFDLQPIFETVAESAVKLCGADRAFIFRFDGEMLRSVVAYNAPSALEEFIQNNPIRPGRSSAAGRAAYERRTVHIPDVKLDAEYTFKSIDAAPLRTILTVPILKNAELLGVILTYSLEVRPFTDKQIALVETFADQAAIAIENVRLFDDVQKRTQELSEALEQQTATSEVLKVISSSPGDLHPVFDAILANATDLCAARFASLRLSEGDQFRAVSLYNAPAALVEHWRSTPLVRPHPESALGRTVLTKQPVQIDDVTKGPAYSKRDPLSVAGADLGGYRTVLSVPMLKEDVLIGAIAIYRQEVRPFTDKQIELVKNFAAQAVIAIENTRLLNETKEALEQQRASAEVLNVISNSVSDAEPVFEKIVESCERIFATSRIGLNLIGPDGLVHAGAYGKFPGAEKLRRENFPHPLSGSATGAAISAGGPIQYPDALSDSDVPQYGRHAAKIVGFRAFVIAPLLSEGRGLGAIFVGRETIGSFSDKEIALLNTFAAQAVIAIENTRLLNELRESLQQQTATSEVLKVISSSPTDIQPVLDAVGENAARLCEANNAVIFRTRWRLASASGSIRADSDNDSSQ